jgi:hypothetical protein
VSSQVDSGTSCRVHGRSTWHCGGFVARPSNRRADDGARVFKLTACETAQVLAARTVLTPTGDFLPTLLSLIMTAATSSESATTEQDHAPLMRRQALLILTNCLQVSKLQNPPSDSFLVAILDTINACVDQPHDACLAVQCLRALHECPRRLNKLGAKQSLHLAHAQGSRRHVRLQGETAKLQLQMSNLM